MKNPRSILDTETSHELSMTKRARITIVDASNHQLTNNIDDLNEFIEDFNYPTSEDVEKLFENHPESIQAEESVELDAQSTNSEESLELDIQSTTPEESLPEINSGELVITRKKFEEALKLKFCEIIKETNEQCEANKQKNEPKPFDIKPYKSIAKNVANTIRNNNIRFYSPGNGKLNVKIKNTEYFKNWIENCSKGIFDNDEGDNDKKIAFTKRIESHFRFAIEKLEKQNINIIDKIIENKRGCYLWASEFPSFNNALLLVDDKTYTKDSIGLLLKELVINKFNLSLDDGKTVAGELRDVMGIIQTFRSMPTLTGNQIKKTAPKNKPPISNYKIKIELNRFAAWINKLSEKKETNETVSNPIQATISQNAQPTNIEKSSAGYSNMGSTLFFNNANLSILCADAIEKHPNLSHT